MDPNIIESQLADFIKWIDEQPELPKNFDRINLVRYLKASEFNLDEAKRLFRKSLQWRKAYPNIFTQRDAYSKEMSDLIKVIQYVPMPTRTSEHNRVSIVRLTDPNPDLIDFNTVIKMFFMVADIRLASLDDIWSEGEIPIWDMSNITIRHFPKLVLSTMRLFMKYTQEAHPVKVVQLHIINCNALLNKGLAVVKPFLKKDVAERIHFHTPNSDTLYKYIPRHILPKDLGGTDNTLEFYQKIIHEYLGSYRDYLMDDERWRLNV
ncbi:hypothetical protein PVAND_009980 [Polypedilum vanderplanki]|uniref:CRAL-TRIO domain-containing protein n=1 Tax=Polypedilum vanderplanki TaxID=319348 RepID=A0A9J6CF89_POLVA|nr:hypothetical protein PVAND_009980 [Polypedilum vanderplanki]